MADTGDEQDCSCNRPLCPSCYEQDTDDPSGSEDQDSNDSNDSGEDSEEFDCNCVGDQAENCTCLQGFQEDSDSDQLRPISPPAVHYHQHYYTVVLPSAPPSFFSPPHLGPPQPASSTLPAPRFLPVTYEPPPPYDPKVEQENTDDEQHADEQEQEEQGRHDHLPYNPPNEQTPTPSARSRARRSKND